MYLSLSGERPGFLVCHLDTARGRTSNNLLSSSLAQWQLSITVTHTTRSPALSVSTDDNVFMWNYVSRFLSYSRAHPSSYEKEGVWDTLQETQIPSLATQTQDLGTWQLSHVGQAGWAVVSSDDHVPPSPQEMLALGCSNFFGSFFKIHVICCALSVTLAVDGAGGKSQVSNFSSSSFPYMTLLDHNPLQLLHAARLTLLLQRWRSST